MTPSSFVSRAPSPVTDEAWAAAVAAFGPAPQRIRYHLLGCRSCHDCLLWAKWLAKALTLLHPDGLRVTDETPYRQGVLP